jgi:hypothetical protein
VPPFKHRERCGTHHLLLGKGGPLAINSCFPEIVLSRSPLEFLEAEARQRRLD